MGNAADPQPAAAAPVAPLTPSVAIELSVTPVLSSALAHAGVPVVPRLSLRSTGCAVRGAVVRLTVQDAEGPLGTAVERRADLAPDHLTVLSDAGPALDPDALARVAEPRPGWVSVEVEADGQVLAQRRVPVRVLAAGQWLATPLPLALELLASHVRPQDPALAALEQDAAALLEEGTGSASMPGYGEGPERVDEVVDALAWALRRCSVRRTPSPVSWTGEGQVARTPGEVLGERSGTALDVVLTLAAACERAGIRPLLWIVEGHAFLGHWREERSAPTTATTDVAALRDAVDQGVLRLIETTILTEGAEDAADLQHPAYAAWLAGDLSRVLGVTDVHRAREDGVLPLPTGGPAGASAEPPAGRTPPAAPEDDLLDLAGRDVLPLALPGAALPLLTELLRGGATLTLLDGDEPTAELREHWVRAAAELPPETLSGLLTEQRTAHLAVPAAEAAPRRERLVRRTRDVLERTGVNELHLALGTLVWAEEGRPMRSPLYLLPVLLSPAPDGRGTRLCLDEAGTGSPNQALLAHLAQAHGLSVPGLGDPDDDVGPDVAATLAAVGRALAEHDLPWLIEPTADLAVLPLAAQRVARDAAVHRDRLAAAPLAARLIGATDEPLPALSAAPGPVALDELAAACPLPADGAQLRAVAAALAGDTFVLEGPPGTGKSQTVTNLLSRAAARGTPALFVSANRTALDVVARRLESVGLRPLTLDLYGNGSRPAVVRAQLRAALDATVELDVAGLAADTEVLHQSRQALARYAEQLWATSPAGTSYASAQRAVLAAGTGVDALPVPLAFAADADADTVTGVRRALALLPDIAARAHPAVGHGWGFIDTVEVDIDAVQQAALAVDTAVRELPGDGALAAVLRAASTPEDLAAITHVLAGPRLPLEVLDEVRTDRWTAATDDLLAEVAALVAAEHPGLDVATPAALDLPLGDLFVQAQTAAASSLIGRRSRLAAVRDQLAPALRPGAGVRTRDVPELTAALRRVQATVQSIAQRASAVPGLQVPARWNPFLDDGHLLLDAEVRWLRRAAASIAGDGGFPRALRRFLATGPVADPAAARTVVRLRNALRSLLTVCSSNSALLDEWSGDSGLVLHWTMTRPERGVEYVHPMSLRRWVSLLDTLEPLRLAGLTEARRLLLHGRVPAEDAVPAFERGLAEAALAERTAATGLAAFHPGRHEATAIRLPAAAGAVRSRLTAALPAAALAARRLDGGTAGDGGRLGALRQELAGRGRGLGLRGLLSTYGELVTAAMPVVLATPDSVARFLPPTADLFDLVVVDEASQLPVEEALGALGRARSAVVVGDGRQLPPLSSPEDDGLLAACLRAGVPRLELSWHYRSRDELLIAFSNALHYGDRLRSFPAPSAGRDAITLLQVPGRFSRSGRDVDTNPGEAAAVVAEVRRRLAADPATSLAVVTLTGAQRTLVEHLLRTSGDQRVLAALDAGGDERLLVRHVAEVQGEERDVVLLSIGFGPDGDGRVPLHLGPLSRAGGERWLNVAVSRARRQVVVVTSFAPDQLPAEETAAAGVRHLRAYLELAARGVEALPRGARPAGEPDLHREDVAAALRERGLVVRTDVGLSGLRIDLAVASPGAPGTPVLAVLLDGPDWAGRETVGDRDVVPVEVLRGRQGWPAVERVWLPTWIADRAGVVDRLAAAVWSVPLPEQPAPALPVPELPGAEPAVASAEVVVEDQAESYDGPLAEVIPFRRSTAPATTEPAAAPVSEGVPAGSSDEEPAPASRRAARRTAAKAEPALLDDEQPFVAWKPKPAGEKQQLDQLKDPAVGKAVRRVLNAGIRAEGPVHRDRLTRLAAGSFGLTRVTEARRDALLGLLPTSAVDGDYLWPKGVDKGSWSGFRRQASSTVRPLEHVAPEELANAMVALTRAADGLTEDALFTATVGVFGHRRRTPAQQPLLEAALAHARATGRLTGEPDRVVPT
ncbi:AAA domain-containing protein [Modestobacter sp. I12A-02662]|uniref:AAA domain-containing protein n=1 Tax=Modestobacter sp. I12A-02662 TaxID=1730496 RepID=UPI0034DE68A6